MPETKTIATIGELRKNSRETVRVSLQEFSGHQLCAVRVWTVKDDGTVIPTKSGINVRVQMLDGLIEMMIKARDEARDRGLIGG